MNESAWRDCSSGGFAVLAVVLALGFAAANSMAQASGESTGELVCDGGLSGAYAPSAWPGVHRDPANSDFAPFVLPHFNRVYWSALEGAAVLAQPSMDVSGVVYVTTGQGPGTSHLHAFAPDGTLLWESDPQQGLSDLDSAVAFCAPAIDVDGDIYVCDSNQVWAFHRDGEVKWSAELPQADSLIPSVIITNEGYVGGVTIRGQVVLLQRNDGTLAVPVVDLPGGSGPAGPAAPQGLWAGGLLDPSIIQEMFDITFGWEVEVANTPSIHPDTGRMYITAAGALPTEGVLYGLDITETTVEIAFQSPMGGGSGTSPAVSSDGAHVYAVDGNGELTAFDADTGEVVWQATGAGAAASPAIGPDGTIYSGGGDVLLALDPADGAVLWSSNFDDLAAAHLRRMRLRLGVFPTGLPIARTNSVVSVSATAVWVALVLGYEFVPTGTDTSLIQPRKTMFAAVNPVDGSLIGTVDVGDTSEGTISLGSNGHTYVRHGAILSSIFYYGVNPQLPDLFDIPGPPIAGLTVLGPVSLVDHAVRSVDWVSHLLDEVQDAIATADAAAALQGLCRGEAQLLATAESLASDLGDELAPDGAAGAGQLVLQAHGHLDQARQLLSTDLPGAATEVAMAEAKLPEALAALDAGRTAQIDVIPGSCPNEVSARPRWRDRIEVAVVGTAGFDINQINTASLRLSRGDGVGGMVEPIQRRRRPSTRIDDVSSPSLDRLGTCRPREEDGVKDRVFAFSAKRVAAAFRLDAALLGSAVPVKLEGLLIDGSNFAAFDTIVVTEAARLFKCKG